MKSLFAVILFAVSAFAQGRVQQTTTQLGNTNNWVVAFNWTGDTSSGAVPATVARLDNCCQGYLITQVETVPGSVAPTSGYSVAINDAAGVDTLGGVGASLSNTAAQSFPTSLSSPPVQGTFSLVITGQSVGGATGKVYVFLSKPGQVNVAALGGSQGFFTQAGSRILRTVQSKLQEVFSVQDFGAKGDGTTNDTAAILMALTVAAVSGNQVYFPVGNYAVTSVDLTTTGSVSVRGAGPKSATIKRHSSALQASTPLLKVTNASNVLLRDLGWNELGNGSNYTNAASTVYLKNVASATVDNNYSTLGQSNAFLFDSVSDITFTNNWMESIWNAGFASGGGGTVASPVYANRILVANNRCNNMAMCIQATGFSRDIAITGNVAYKSSISLIQAADRATITGNVVDGGNDYGLVFAQDGIFLEGISQFNISGNKVYNSAKNGINVAGSELTIGTTVQLPILKGLIEGNQIDAPASAGIQLVGQSFDHSVQGSQVSVKGNSVTNAFIGYAIGAMDGFDITGNTADGIQTTGIQLSVVQNGTITGNRIYNVSQLSVNSYYGISIGNDPTTTKNLYINGNVIIDKTGHMRFGVLDSTLDNGAASQVRHCGNTISGAVSLISWFPQPIIPAIGTWDLNDCIENFPVAGASTYAANIANGWHSIKAGTPGTWSPDGFTTYPACVTGAASPISCDPSASGAAVIGAGVGSTVIITSAVKASNAITVTEDDSLGAALGVTCNTTINPVRVVLRSASNSFTVNSSTVPATNPKCFSWRIQQQ